MVDAGGSESCSGSKPMSTCESHGDRLRFTVELRPGETTIVSWKKLLKETTSSKPNKHGPRAAGPSSAANQQPAPQPHPPPTPPALASSEQPAENDVKDAQGQAGTNRLSTVIEKIERMYAGEGTSEDEEVFLDDVPDDDEYDTEDSFIDDAELDDYFQVDNSSIKHDGFFVNRGKLERIEPTTSAKQQPRKRRRKDVTKTQGGNEDVQNPNKHIKLGNKGRKSSSSIERNTTSQFNLHSTNVLEASQADAAGGSMKKKTADNQIVMDPTGSLERKDADQQKVFPSQNHNNKLKDSSELQDASAQRPSCSPVSKPQYGKLNNAKELDQSIQQKDKSGPVERFDLNIPPSRDLPQIAKVAHIPRKEGSNVRPKITVLDKAIRELEKIVAESRPPSTEVQDPDSSSQGVKRRLSPEIKQKLSKVARLAQASYGKIPKDVINRLMSILGHLMQLRTLKRNLRVMANLGLSARKEKDDRLQKTKQEVAEMVRQRVQYVKSKVFVLLVQQQTAMDDFQEISHEEKEALKRKYSMDDALENKICDLYDLYVERLEEDSGPPVRRLYEELTALWPGGVMDTDGIKRAIHKAKDRRRAFGGRQRNQEKVKRKKVLAQKLEDTIRREGSVVSPAMHFHEKILLESRDHASPLLTKLVHSAAVSLPEPYVPFPVASVPNVDKPKQERVKASPNSNPTDAVPVEVLLKKKVKKKQNIDAAEAQLRIEKAPEAEEKTKHHKHITVPPKLNLQPGAQSGSDNHS
ncbi:ubinuclein-1-like isoform X3 [Salvia miltiorrhiza]|uniref:ubinuclein-1-like isoform X3 n=1 Tax=Salvia miltiorrhiza TaxID=226208 RepID=UPI0025ACBC64|nr:ubinuclein-1-like isoform X3 [Salvia miltiorrhiza]